MPWGAETIDSIKKIEETALLNNLEYKTSILEVLRAKNDLDTVLKLDDSTVNLSAGYSSAENSSAIEKTSSVFDWSMAATLPVIEQISLGARLSKELDTTISMNINPLAHSKTVETSKLSYQQKIAKAKQTAMDVKISAVRSYLNWAVAKIDYEIKQKSVDIKKTFYEDEKIRLNCGESNLDEVRSAFTAWSDARTSLNVAITLLTSSKAELYAVLNIDSENVNIIEPDLAMVNEAVEVLEKSINIEELSESSSYEILNAEINKQNLNYMLNNTWLFEPDLNINAALVIPSNGETPQFSATASVNLGLNNWKANDREEIEKEFEISKQNYNQTIKTEKLKLEQSIISAQNATINYAIAEVGLEQAQELLDEADFLFETGDYSAASRAETELEYEISQKLLFNSAVEKLLALKTLATYSDNIN